MSKETLEYVVAKAKELIVAPSCSAEAKEAAQAWIAAVGTDKQARNSSLRWKKILFQLMD